MRVPKELEKMNSMTETVLSDLIEAFEMDFSIREACAHAGISPDTYYRWIKESDRFNSVMERAQSSLGRVAKRNWSKAINKQNLDASIKWLERRQKNLYSLRNEITDADGKPLVLNIFLDGRKQANSDGSEGSNPKLEEGHD